MIGTIKAGDASGASAVPPRKAEEPSKPGDGGAALADELSHPRQGVGEPAEQLEVYGEYERLDSLEHPVEFLQVDVDDWWDGGHDSGDRAQPLSEVLHQG